MIQTLTHCREGLPIEYDEENDSLIYKDNHIPYTDLKEAYDSGYDRVQLTEKLTYRYVSGLCIYGCLELQEIEVKKLINKIEKWKQSTKLATSTTETKKQN